MNKLIDNQIQVDGRVEQLNIAQVTDTNKVTWVYYVDGYSLLQRFKIGVWETDPTFHYEGSADNVKAEIDAETWYDSPLGAASGYYIFTYTNGHWYYNENVVDITTYGITLIGGSAAEGAHIYVSYTVTTGGTKTLESYEYVDARPVAGASLIMFHNNRLLGRLPQRSKPSPMFRY